MRRTLVCAFLTLVVPACLDPLQFDCEAPAQCQLNGEAGTCVFPPGHCAYPADDCESSLRFGPTAADVAGECVPAGVATDTGSDTAGGCEAGCPAPAGSCLGPGMCVDGVCEHPTLPAGEPCDDDDACTMASVCDAAGECIGSEPVVCDPPSADSCMGAGTCDPSTGECSFEPAPAGTSCEDGNPCTMGDTCNAEGVCASGEECPSDDPCQVSTCDGTSCVAVPAADGTACDNGGNGRCCSGSCVDITSDPEHCGQCGFACVDGNACISSLEEPLECSDDVPAPTGRCRCNGLTSQCRGGDDDATNDQTCRTVAPGEDLCTPDSAGECLGDAEFAALAGCPNACYYE